VRLLIDTNSTAISTEPRAGGKRQRTLSAHRLEREFLGSLASKRTLTTSAFYYP